MSNPIGDFAKNTLGLSDADLKALQDVAAIIGTVSGFIGYVLALKGILTAVGLFQQTDEVQQLVTQLWRNFQVVLEGLNESQTMRDVANQIETARSELENYLEFAPDDPAASGIDANWDKLSPFVLDNTLRAVNTLGDPAYWQRPFFTDLVYFSEWTNSLTPPLEGNLVFDYRLTLPAYLEAIAIRIIILAALVKDYRTKNSVEIYQYITTLEGYFKTIRDGIVELRPPQPIELTESPLAMSLQGPANCLWTTFGTWPPGQGDLFGAVERYSTFQLVDSWPAEEYPLAFLNTLMTSTDPNAYSKFLVRHVVRTMSRWKQIYNKIGLGVLAATLVQLRALVGISPVALEPPTGDWSVRELAQRVSATPAIVPYLPIRLSAVLQTLQTFNPTPYTSLRAAVAQ
jgi:hypothetical protein